MNKIQNQVLLPTGAGTLRRSRIKLFSVSEAPLLTSVCVFVSWGWVVVTQITACGLSETEGRLAHWDQGSGDWQTISYPVRDLEVENNNHNMIIANI